MLLSDTSARDISFSRRAHRIDYGGLHPPQDNSHPCGRDLAKCGHHVAVSKEGQIVIAESRLQQEGSNNIDRWLIQDSDHLAEYSLMLTL